MSIDSPISCFVRLTSRCLVTLDIPGEVLWESPDLAGLATAMAIHEPTGSTFVTGFTTIDGINKVFVNKVQ